MNTLVPAHIEAGRKLSGAKGTIVNTPSGPIADKVNYILEHGQVTQSNGFLERYDVNIPRLEKDLEEACKSGKEAEMEKCLNAIEKEFVALYPSFIQWEKSRGTLSTMTLLDFTRLRMQGRGEKAYKLYFNNVPFERNSIEFHIERKRRFRFLTDKGIDCGLREEHLNESARNAVDFHDLVTKAHGEFIGNKNRETFITCVEAIGVMEEFGGKLNFLPEVAGAFFGEITKFAKENQELVGDIVLPKVIIETVDTYLAS